MILTKDMIPDTIAVVYRITVSYNSSNYLSVEKVAIKKDKKNGCYFLDPFSTYLIYASKSRYRVENNVLTCTYNSICKYTTDSE